ncbi:MAG: hypothetical protein NUW01_19215 [Gemmatimonadaceae bacterium]|nr:hypothetical protein [Gemmatimonadaceae bacterium]
MSDANTDIRGKQSYTGGGDAMVNIGADFNKNLMVSQAAAPYAEVSRRGDGWTVGTTTLFAPLVAYPTTVAALEVYNNGVRTMVVSDLYAAQILSTAASQTYGLFAMITTQKAVPSLTALSVFSLSGKPLVTPTASGEIVTGVGTTVVANGWRPYGNAQAWGTATATPGNSWSVPIDGRLIVPPNCSICLHVVGALATASTFQAGLSFNWDSMTVEA